MEEHNYSFADGLQIEQATFLPDGTIEENAFTVEPDKVNLQEDDTRHFARLEAEIDNKKRARVNHNGRIRSFEYVVLNDTTATDGSLTFYPFPWGGSFNNPLGRYELQVLGSKYPDRRFLAVSTPGAGGTDRLPLAVSREIAKTGSYQAYGEYAATAFGEVIDDFDLLHLRGNSQGARYSIALGGALETDKIQTVAITDPVSFEELGLVGIGRALQKEAGHSAAYTEASTDARGKKAAQDINAPLYAAKEIAKLIMSGGVVDQFGLQPIGLSKGQAEQDLQRLVPNVRESLVINFPELSEYNRPEAIRESLARVALHKDRPAHIQQRVMKGHTHLYHDGNAAAHAFLIANS